MAYWWVSQNQTYRHERDGGFLWAPKVDKGGQSQYHWRTMLDVRPGDIIFSFVDKAIQALSIAETSATESVRPAVFSDDAPWKKEGYEIKVSYQDLDKPLLIAPIVENLLPLLPERYSPLTKNGTGVQGYLFSVPDAAGAYIMAATGKTGEAELDSSLGARVAVIAIERSTLPTTEKEALVKSRIGQGRFRDDLLRMWAGACAVTGFSIVRLLRASHIKPWSSSDNAERLDCYNGLLLAPHYDAAFDAGLVSFSDQGEILISKFADPLQMALLNIKNDVKLRGIEPRHQPYLDHHRKYVLKHR